MKQKPEYQQSKYNKAIAISEEDKAYIISLKEYYPRMSQAGILSYIIKKHKENL